jgi:hypothetical protein
LKGGGKGQDVALQRAQMAAKAKRTARKKAQKARQTARNEAQRAAFNTITDVSHSEQTTYDLLADLMVRWVRRMKSALRRPNSGQINEIFNQLGANVDLNIPDGFDQEVEDDNSVHDQLMKLMLLMTLENMISAEERANGIHPLIRSIKESLSKLPSDHSTFDSDVMLRYLRSHLGNQYQEKPIHLRGGMLKRVLTAAAAAALAQQAVANPQTNPGLIHITSPMYPSGTIPFTPNSSYTSTSEQSINPNNEENENNIQVTTPQILTTINSTLPNHTQTTRHNDHAIKMLQNRQIQTGQHPITHKQKQYMALSDGIYQWTGLDVYSPFRDFEPLVSKTMKQKFGFIRQQMELLKTKLAIHSPERYGGLQYNSIINILQMIRVGDTKLVNEFPQSKLTGRTKVRPVDIKEYMTKIANYDRQIEDIYIYVQRRPPTAADKVTSLFGFKSNYIIEKIIIMFNVNTPNASNSFYMSFNPIQIDSDFKPFAARFVMPNVGNIQQVIEAIDDVLKLEASYIGFWHPSTPTAAIIANLDATNVATKDIIADMGKFSEIAFALTKLRMGDFLINGLSQVVNDPSTAFQMRLRSYQLQDSIYTLASSEQEWDIQKVDQLVDLATSIALSSGKLDQTLKDDKAIVQFIKDTTSKFGGALRDSIDAVAETAEFFGGSLKRLTTSANKLSKDIIRREIMFMYITFFVYYLTMGSCTMKLLSWAAPLLNPVGPVIALESVLESTSGIQPSSITAILMLYLFYRIWDKEKVAPITGTIMEVFQMFRCSKAGIAISAASSPSVPSNKSSAEILASLSSFDSLAEASSSAVPSSAPATPRGFGRRKSGFGPPTTPNARAAEAAARAIKLSKSFGFGGGHTRKRKHNTKRTRRHRR